MNLPKKMKKKKATLSFVLTEKSRFHLARSGFINYATIKSLDRGKIGSFLNMLIEEKFSRMEGPLIYLEHELKRIIAESDSLYKKEEDIRKKVIELKKKTKGVDRP